MKPATILITMPRKANDPTEYTYVWASKMEKIAKQLGYDLVTIKGRAVTYDKVTQALTDLKPRLYVHVGHGCLGHLNGYNECIVTRKYSADEIINMDAEKLNKMVNPLGLVRQDENSHNCGICKLQDDPCFPLCFKDTNVHLLKDKIVLAVACHSAYGLGKCAVAYGADGYIGYENLLLFPVDSMRSQDLFETLHVEIFRGLLMGDSIGEATDRVDKLNDILIRKYKDIKWIGLPLLWDRKNRKVLGNLNSGIYM